MTLVRRWWFLAALAALACGSGTGPTDASDPGPDADLAAPDAPADPDDAPGDLPADAPDAAPLDDVPALDGDALDPGPDLPPAAPGFRLFNLADVGDVYAMWASQEASAWAVGAGGMALRFDGVDFVPVPAPTDRDLLGVSGDGATVFAVGRAGTVLRHDSAGWTALPSPGDVDLAGVGVLDPDEIFVAGKGGAVFHWRDGAWTAEDVGETADLWGMYASRAGGVYAVGAFGTLVERVEDGVWVRTQAAGPATTLRSFWRAPDGQMFAVGSGGAVAKHDGTSWKLQITNDGLDRSLWAVSGTGSDDVIAVGDQGAILRHDGKKWTTQTVAGPYNRDADLRGVAVLAGEAPLRIAAGLGARALELRDKAWQDRPLGVTADLRGVTALSEGALAAGDRGLLLRFADDRFTTVATPTDADLASVSGRWAVGAAGTLLDAGATPVARIVTGTDEDLADVWADGDLAWIAGAAGTVFRLSAGKMERRLETGAPLTAICRSGPRVYAATADGRLLRVEGAEVVTVPSGAPGALWDLAPLPADRVVAVGDNGTVLDCDATSCRRVHEDPASFLYGVATDGDTILAAGWSGLLLRGTSAAGLEAVATGTFRVFRSVAFGPDGQSFLAGLTGTFAIDEGTTP